VLAQDSANIQAMAGLARCYVGTGNLDQAQKTLDMVPEAKRNDTAVAAARAEIELATQTKDLGSIPDLEAKVAANPADHQARFELALAQNAKGDREAATDNLIAIVKRDRKWNDDGARKQLVQLFDAWGPTDEATVAGRKKLSSVLFA
jgi:putative thioredoxin